MDQRKLGLFRREEFVPSAKADSDRFPSFPGTYVPGYLYVAAVRLELNLSRTFGMM